MNEADLRLYKLFSVSVKKVTFIRTSDSMKICYRAIPTCGQVFPNIDFIVDVFVRYYHKNNATIITIENCVINNKNDN